MAERLLPMHASVGQALRGLAVRLLVCPHRHPHLLRVLPRGLAALLLTAWLLPGAAPAAAASGPAAEADAALDARVLSLAAELRCLVCQNQSLADSHSGLAADLRRQMREQFAAGRTDAEVTGWLVQRYGDYVHYRPPLDRRTALLWATPALLAGAGAIALALQMRRRRRLDPAAFDPDE